MPKNCHVSFLCLVILATGCGAPIDSETRSAVPGEGLPSGLATPVPGTNLADSQSNTCFGIRNDFCGTLSDDQEAGVPESFRGAFHIEAVREVTLYELAQEMEGKEAIAQESRGGIEYVALQDFRCVQFDGGVSGQMIVIERYRIRDE